MLSIAVVLAAVSLGGPPESRAMEDCTLPQHHAYVRAIYTTRPKLTRRALRRSAALRQCLPTDHTRRIALRFTRRMRDRREMLVVIWAVRAKLDSIAACESKHDPRAISSSGAYRGKYQFDYGTWASVGGSGDPAAAPETEQDYRAALLLSRRGSAPWPVCG